MKNQNLHRMLEETIRESENALHMCQAMVKAAGDIRHTVNKTNLVLKAVLEDLGQSTSGQPDEKLLSMLDRTAATARQLAAQAQQSQAAPAVEDHHHDHDHHHHDSIPTSDELIARCSEEELNNRRTLLHLLEGPDNIFTRILASTTMRGGVGKISVDDKSFPSYREDIGTLTEHQFMNPAWTTGFYRNSKTGSSQFLLRTEDFVLYCLDLNEPLETMKLGIFMINGMPEDLDSGVAGKPVFARWICYKSMHYVLTKVCKMFNIPLMVRTLVQDDGPTPSVSEEQAGPTPA